MSGYAAKLKAFQLSQCDLPELIAMTAELASDPVSAESARQLLSNEFSAGQLNDEIFTSLIAVLNDKTRVYSTTHSAQSLPPNIADEPTMILAPASASETPTVVQSIPIENIPPLPDHKSPTQTSDTKTSTVSLLNADSLLAEQNHLAGSEITVGSVLKNRFELQQLLGVGGMGKVFKALDLRKVEAADKEPYVALKVLNRDFQTNSMALMALQRESKRAQTLAHPNIIKVYDFDRDGAHVFMSMEYLQGRPLSQLIREHDNGLPYKQTWPIIHAMAAALAYAHQKSIVHSDFKPGNVFVTEQNEIRILDFGIACAIGRNDQEHQDATVFNARDLGALTPTYASLEQLQNRDPDPKDDIYALACVSYELLTGKHPFGRLSAEKVQELNLQAKPISKLSRRQWKGLQHALALHQEQRTATVDQFIKNLAPRSPFFYGFLAIGILLTSLIAFNVYMGLTPPQSAEPPKINIVLNEQQQQQIKDLLDLASIHYDVGYLTAPTGSNALWAYQEILKIDPYNQAAIAGINKIADTLEQQAWEAYEKGDRTTAIKKIQAGLEANPNHKGLLRIQEKLKSAS